VSPLATRILLTAAIAALKYLRRRQALLTPEQKKELDEAMRESFEQAGNMGSGVGD